MRLLGSHPANPRERKKSGMKGRANSISGEAVSIIGKSRPRMLNRQAGMWIASPIRSVAASNRLGYHLYQLS